MERKKSKIIRWGLLVVGLVILSSCLCLIGLHRLVIGVPVIVKNDSGRTLSKITITCQGQVMNDSDVKAGSTIRGRFFPRMDSGFDFTFSFEDGSQCDVKDVGYTTNLDTQVHRFYILPDGSVRYGNTPPVSPKR